MRVVAWGTYDTGKPRVRILLRGLAENQINVVQCHKNVWGDIEDKSQIKGWANKLGKLLKWIASYPHLLWRYLKEPKHDVVLISYMGQLDILFIWLFAKWRKTPIVWDAFLSLYNTVVEDRKLISPHNPLAWGLYVWEWLACRAADIIILDTEEHGDYFVNKFNIKKDKVKCIFVGVETEMFPSQQQAQNLRNSTPTILFYGQFIPLHGIETIIKAARLAKNDNIKWNIVGSGQEQDRIQTLIEEEPLHQLDWIPWIEYHDLIKKIHEADICLGIFGATEKAARVIPNKVFQLISAGVPIITMDSPAVREIFDETSIGVKLVEPANPLALYTQVTAFITELSSMQLPLHQNLIKRITPINLGAELAILISEKVKK